MKEVVFKELQVVLRGVTWNPAHGPTRLMLCFMLYNAQPLNSLRASNALSALEVQIRSSGRKVGQRRPGQVLAQSSTVAGFGAAPRQHRGRAAPCASPTAAPTGLRPCPARPPSPGAAPTRSYGQRRCHMSAAARTVCRKCWAPRPQRLFPSPALPAATTASLTVCSLNRRSAPCLWP